jgi:hypothetical protein
MSCRCLVLLVVVEDQGVDALQVLAQTILELVGGVLAAAIIGGRREVAEAALAAHAGLAEAEQGDVFLEAGELVAVGADGVDQRMDALAKKMPLKLSWTKLPALALSARSASISSSLRRTELFSMIALAAWWQ